MKTKLIAGILTVFCVTGVSFAQDKEEKKKSTREVPETLFNMSDSTFSGYGAPVVRFTNIGGDFAVLAGGRGGLIINESFVIGAGGYGLAYPRDRKVTVAGAEEKLYLGYGGGMIEYYFMPKKLVNFSAGVLIGGGSAMNGRQHNSNPTYTDRFFAIEPELNAFINLARFCRVGAGVSYRYSYGLKTEGLKDKDFRGVSGSLIFEFGWF